MTPHPLRWLALLALLAGCSSCAVLRSIFPGRLDPPKIDADEVPGTMEEAERAFAAEDWAQTVRLTRAVENVRGIDPLVRQRAQSLLEQAADAEVRRLAAAGDADGLHEVATVDLPRQIAVSAGLEQARILVERGKLMKAFHALEALDERYPLHHERYASASLLVDVGLTLAEDDSGFLWWNKRDDGIAVLEYVVLNAPWDPRCDEAYFELASCYADDRDWALAIERHEDLLLYHPESALRPLSQALVPALRLDALRSPEYDRAELLHARRELETWIATYAAEGESAGPGLERTVRLELADCLRRLVDSDLGIARFYRRVHNAFGQRLHASRALETAEVAQDAGRAAAARALLAELPPAAAPLPGPAPDEPQESAPEQGP